MVGQKKDKGDMHIPPPGMVRTPGILFKQKIGWTGWGGGSLPALYPQIT
jgi:hypothetical protein